MVHRAPLLHSTVGQNAHDTPKNFQKLLLLTGYNVWQMSSESRRKVLCITLEPLSERMAGPAIRCFELGQQLAAEFDVSVASTCAVERAYAPPPNEFLKIEAGVGKSRIYQLASESDVLFIQANVLKPLPALTDMKKPIVLDLYDTIFVFSACAIFG